MRYINYVVYGLVVLYCARLVAWFILRYLKMQLSEIIQAQDAIHAKHGIYPVQIERANVKPELDQLKEKAARVYRIAVPVAAFLLWWPFVFLSKERILRETTKRGISLRIETVTLNIYHDLRRGHARRVWFNPVGVQRNRLGALSAARLL